MGGESLGVMVDAIHVENPSEDHDIQSFIWRETDLQNHHDDDFGVTSLYIPLMMSDGNSSLIIIYIQLYTLAQ